MTREELLRDAAEARELGDDELELSILEKLDSMPAQADQQKESSLLDSLKNSAYGFAARGNQAMTALNPFADQEDYNRIAAEQQWVKQNSGAGVGEILADMAITLPAGGLGSIPARALASGGLEGATEAGGLVDKIKAAGYGALGSGLGEGVANGVGFLLQPFRAVADPAADALRAKAKAMNIPLNAAQSTGNKTLGYLDSALDYIPSSSSAQQEAKQAQRLAWQKKLFSEGGEYADAPTQETMGLMKDRISGVYETVAGRNDITVDALLKSDLAKVKADTLGRIPTNQKGIVKSYLNDFDTAPQGAFISGKTYQDIRSMLDKQAKAFKNSDPATYQALSDIRGAADRAMARSSSPADAAAWDRANHDWMVMKNIEQATDPTNATVSAAKLMNNLARKDSNRVIYGKGDQALTDIGKVGKKFIGDKLPDSGTAQRSAMINMLTGGGLGGAGAIVGASLGEDPVTGGGLGLLGTGLFSILAPKAAQKMLWNQNGYLSKGLIDMNKELMPGLLRSRALSELGRLSGSSVANQ
jgi:hypothetical protein